MIRAREDLAEQTRRLTEARDTLADALADLAAEAKTAAKAARATRGAPDLPKVYALADRVRRCEETVDLAAYDLSTAAGEDG